MDLTFSPKSQTLTLLSTTQFSSNPKSSASIRTEFLGSSHHLRPPGPIRGRKYKKIKIREKKRAQTVLLINGSFRLDSVLLVVAVSTVSAFSFAYFHHHFTNANTKKKITSSKQVLGDGLSKLGRNIVENLIRSPFLDAGHFHKVSTTTVLDVKSEDLLAEDSREKQNSYVIENSNALSNQSSAILVKSVENNGNSVSSSVSTCVVTKENDASSLNLAIPGSESVLPLEFARELSDLTAEKSRSEAEVDSELRIETIVNGVEVDSELRIETIVNGVEVDSKLMTEKTVNEAEVDSEWAQLLAEKTNCASPSVSDVNGGKHDRYGIIRESVREDLYTFYKEKHSNRKSPWSTNGLSKVPSRATSLIGNSISSSMVNHVMIEPRSAHQSPQVAESVQSEVHLAPYERSPPKNEQAVGSRRFPREKEKVHGIQDEHTKIPEFPYLNGVHAIKKDHIPEQVYGYNRLLRDGRLAECLDLLEDAERRGSLDMNKIYHAKFFKICKTQKSVKEAFRFCKLVPNPTLSTFNMLMSVCASSQDSVGAFGVLKLAQGAGLKADCKLYTTLISTCAKSGKVDAMFEVFHKMVNAGVEPNVHTYGALIDGCARAGKMAKAFGAYGILRSKNVQPDRVVFNALITACGQSGAVDRAFDVLAEMGAEIHPIDPDHITIGALMKACEKAGQVDRAKEVYNMMHKFNIKGTPEVYTIAVNCCSQTADWDFARSIYEDMTRNGVAPDEMFLSALMDVAGHAGMLDVAFETLQEARIQGTQLGIVPYSSLMGACSNAKNWEKALELYEDIKAINLKPTVPTMNALISALCDGVQLSKAIEILSEMKSFGLCPNTITYSILIVASEKKDDLDAALMLLSQVKQDSVAPTLLMYKCIIGMCLRRYQKACSLGEPILSSDSGWPQIRNEWTSKALMVYRETIAAGEKPTMEVVSQVLGCLQLPYDASLKSRLVENLGVTADPSKSSNLCALVDGFGEYDPCAFSLLEEAASQGTVPCISFKGSPIVFDAKPLQSHIAEVYFLTILKGLKHRLAAGAKLPSVNILLPIETTQIKTPEGEKTINVAGRLGQDVASLLRRLGLPYQGNESYGKIRINGISLRRWLQPKLSSPFSERQEDLSFSLSRLGKGITHQQRNIRTGDLSMD
ncbi:pentatricopeptide repeat-containing protein MRL1, chloroplastic [Mercurialis annua]|uniref:pentatricopeptide repeat-containing protein MRL1, chloroplastic n=1 Tax=Mercurialis annua TaxID=3986 RepID=UPI002160D18E|nr:pentatricopeptide repeat-containing protein MRL1, chloroplastic [Mercurialis annua]